MKLLKAKTSKKKAATVKYSVARTQLDKSSSARPRSEKRSATQPQSQILEATRSQSMKNLDTRPQSEKPQITRLQSVKRSAVRPKYTKRPSAPSQSGKSFAARSPSDMPSATSSTAKSKLKRKREAISKAEKQSPKVIEIAPGSIFEEVAKAYNSKFVSVREILLSANEAVAAYEERKQSKHEAAIKAVNQPDAEGWITVTRKSKNYLRGPTNHAINRKRKQSDDYDSEDSSDFDPSQKRQKET